MREPTSPIVLRLAVAGSSCIAVLCIASSQGWAADPEPAPPPPAATPLPPPPPPPPPPDEKKLSYMLWGRLGATLQSPYDTEKMDKLTANGELDLLVNGQITKEIGITGNLVAAFGPVLGPNGGIGGAITGNANIMDLIARLDFQDEFHLWLGRQLVASDRSNFSGPWFMSPWFYPTFFSPAYSVPQGTPAPPLGPRQGPNGRNDGAAVWGQFKGGMFKYYAGAYNLQDAGGTPLYSARLNLALLNPEPGFYNSSTYYGEKDIVAIGVGGQLQPDGSRGAGAPSDFSEFNADVLVEKTLAGAGVIDVEAAFYKYMGDNETNDFSWFGLVSYLTEDKVGPGKIQPLIRLQQNKPKTGDTWTIIDVQAGYVVNGSATRFALGYQNSSIANVKGNAIFFGVQLQHF